MTAEFAKPRAVRSVAIGVLLLVLTGCAVRNEARAPLIREMLTGIYHDLSPKGRAAREVVAKSGEVEVQPIASLGAPQHVGRIAGQPVIIGKKLWEDSQKSTGIVQVRNDPKVISSTKAPVVHAFAKSTVNKKAEALPARISAPPVETPPGRRPIDLASAMRLAGANNLQIALAAEKIRAAQARYSGAKVMWLPSINAGLGYNKHEGRIQDTRGNVIEVSRSSLFAGGGPVVGGAFPVTGGSGGPARLAVDFSLADGIFEPLAKLQLVNAAQASRDAAFNNAVLQVVLAYLDLTQAQGEVAAAQEAAKNAERLLALVQNRVKAGRALSADGLRAETESTRRQSDLLRAEEKVAVASAELVRLLSLEPGVILYPAESHAVPVDLFPHQVPLCDLIAQALSTRPELIAQDAYIQATDFQIRQEHWRPFIPNLHLGMTAGGFGGSDGSQVRNFGDRMDADALLVWNIQNLGLGNKALRDERISQKLQAVIGITQIRDVVAKEVTIAYHQMRLRNRQLGVARGRVEAAAKAVPLNFQGIIGDELRAVEAQQAIDALASARVQYLRAIIDYNRSQFELLRALGQPAFPSEAVASDCDAHLTLEQTPTQDR